MSSIGTNAAIIIAFVAGNLVQIAAMHHKDTLAAFLIASAAIICAALTRF